VEIIGVISVTNGPYDAGDLGFRVGLRQSVESPDIDKRIVSPPQVNLSPSSKAEVRNECNYQFWPPVISENNLTILR